MCENTKKGDTHKRINTKEEIWPVVNKMVEDWKNKISIEYEDFKSECYLSALTGAKKWEESDKKASLFSWVWIYVSGRIKDFSKKETVITVSFNDNLKLPIIATINNYSYTVEEGNSLSKAMGKTRLNKLSNERVVTYRYLMSMIFPMQMPVLKKMISRQRIHQIQGKAQELLLFLGKQSTTPQIETAGSEEKLSSPLE